MPQIGDLARGKDIERTGRQKWIWASCENCGKERWVLYRKGKPVNSLCFRCGNDTKKGRRVSIATEFKKGQRPINRKPKNTLVIRRDKAGTLRRFIKEAEPNIWIEYAKYLWKRVERELTKGLCLHHLNNNSLDDRIENLIMVSRSDHVKLHNRWNTKNIKVAKGSQMDYAVAKLKHRSIGYELMV